MESVEMPWKLFPRNDIVDESKTRESTTSKCIKCYGTKLQSVFPLLQQVGPMSDKVGLSKG